MFRTHNLSARRGIISGTLAIIIWNYVSGERKYSLNSSNYWLSMKSVISSETCNNGLSMTTISSIYRDFPGHWNKSADITLNYSLWSKWINHLICHQCDFIITTSRYSILLTGITLKIRVMLWSLDDKRRILLPWWTL